MPIPFHDVVGCIGVSGLSSARCGAAGLTQIDQHIAVAEGPEPSRVGVVSVAPGRSCNDDAPAGCAVLVGSFEGVRLPNLFLAVVVERHVAAGNLFKVRRRSAIEGLFCIQSLPRDRGGTQRIRTN